MPRQGLVARFSRRCIRGFIWNFLWWLYGKFGYEITIRDMRHAPGAHSHRSGSHFILGAHVIFFTLMLALPALGQQGGQTSSTPPLTGSTVPGGNCGVGSLYVNTTNGDFYDCNAGAWLRVGPATGGAAHAILSATHTDTTAAAVVRGDLMSGQGATPTWSRLALGLSGQCLTSNGTDAAWGSCAAGGTSWSGITAPTANLSLSHAAFTTTFTWNATTGAGVNLFTFTDTLNNTGTGILGKFTTASGSAATPWQADANGNGWLVDSTGLHRRVGAASIAIPGTARGVILSQGATAAITTTTAGVAGQVLLSNGAGTDPSFQDPIVSGQTATATDTLTVAGFSTSVSLSGGAGAVMRLTFGGTITTLDVRGQVSIDGGANFQDVDTYNISSEVVQLSITSATAADYSIYVPAGATHVRANVVTLTGTTPSITIAVRTSYVANPRTHTAFDRVPGSSDPSHVAAIGASDGTNTQRLRTATAAPVGTEQGLIVRNIPSGTQTVSGTVTANIGTTGGLALDASVTGLQVAQGSATAGQKGELIQGAVTTAAPTYTTGNTNPLSLTTSGGLRVDGSGVTQPVSGTVTANQGTANATPWNENVAQINGVAPLMGNGVTGTGSPRVTIASDNSNSPGIGGSATGAAVPSAARYDAGNASGNLTGAIFCDNWTNINQTAGAQLVAGVAAKRTYICNLFIYSATAQNVALVEGTGVVCATGIAGLMGGSTAATGQNLAANQGFVLPASTVPWRKTATAADNVCLLQSGTGQISGVIAWTQF